MDFRNFGSNRGLASEPATFSHPPKKEEIMTMFKLHIEMDNSAFDDGNEGRSEAARIIHAMAERLSCGQEDYGTLKDSNGNTVGGYDTLRKNNPEA